MKSIDQRIAYYTRKVAERCSHHPAKILPPSYKYREGRLKLYKTLLRELIEAER
jgi:hypothetical protein